MIEEAKQIVAALRTSCEENGSCPDCPINYWCQAKNGVRLEDDAADIIESLIAQLEQVEMERDGLNILLAQAQAMLETRTKERDAAVEDLKEADLIDCMHCKAYEKNAIPCQCDCESCKIVNCVCKTCVRNSNWQWRGVREVEHGI